MTWVKFPPKTVLIDVEAIAQFVAGNHLLATNPWPSSFLLPQLFPRRINFVNIIYTSGGHVVHSDT